MKTDHPKLFSVIHTCTHVWTHMYLVFHHTDAHMNVHTGPGGGG